MKKTIISSAIIAILTSMTSVNIAIADGHSSNSKHHKFFNFKSLTESANSADWDATAPWKLPKGFTQTVVSDETVLNIYDGGRDDWNDMNVVNETGPMAGRFMYRTHEVRGVPEGGAVSVVDLKTGETRILAQDLSWTALDGIRWTPWNTLVFAEETEGGRLFEIVLNEDMMSAAEIIDRPAVGRLAHEGIDLDKDGNVYIVDEHRGRTSGCEIGTPCGGGIYKFVPDVYGDLSTGSLYVLKVTGPDGTGQGEWVGPIDPMTARSAGTVAGGQSYQRPEDLEIINNTLYVAVTEGPRDPNNNKEFYEGRVISIHMDSMKVRNFIKPDVNVPVEIGKPGEEGHQTGFDSVDNLAETPDGNLMVIEDNKPSDIWVASTKTNKFGTSKKVKLFASLTDPEAEGTGIYFSPLDPNTLYVNVQHSASEDGDATWAITKEGRDHD